jgi:hypothetical protein
MQVRRSRGSLIEIFGEKNETKMNENKNIEKEEIKIIYSLDELKISWFYFDIIIKSLKLNEIQNGKKPKIKKKKVIKKKKKKSK